MTQSQIEWIDGQPFSRRYGDIYFSRDSGLAESRHVFLDGNNLEARWRSLRSQEIFVIGETGFGTGLNFLAAWQLWDRVDPDGRLHFFSFEQAPLTREQLRLAHALWPELSAYSARLCELYGPLSEGWHRFLFAQGKVILTLAIGDAHRTLPRFSGRAHAWFLDGFSPARNPLLWESSLLLEVARHAHVGATAATFTSAGFVRRGLQAAGFDVRKQPGHGHKREMTCATWPGAREAPTRTERRAIVIGAGVAGCGTARALAMRGWQVELVDESPQLAGGASGLPQATLHIRLPRKFLPSHLLALLGYQFTVRLCQQLSQGSVPFWQQCGTLQLDHASRRIIDAASLDDMHLPTTLVRRIGVQEASEIAGLPVPAGGLHFPMGGWLDGQAFCSALARHNGISQRLGTTITRFSRDEQGGGWRICTGAGDELFAPVVVLANAVGARALPLLQALPLHAVRGQISLVAANAHSRALKTILCGEGVVTPAHDGFHTLGATYRHDRADGLPTDEEHVENQRMLHTLSPAVHEALGMNDAKAVRSFVGFRATSPDRTPLAGAWRGDGTAGLFLNVAHGSRGFSTGPLLGEYIASTLEGEPSPIPAELTAAVDPQRFAR